MSVLLLAIYETKKSKEDAGKVLGNLKGTTQFTTSTSARVIHTKTDTKPKVLTQRRSFSQLVLLRSHFGRS